MKTHLALTDYQAKCLEQCLMFVRRHHPTRKVRKEADRLLDLFQPKLFKEKEKK